MIGRGRLTRSVVSPARSPHLVRVKTRSEPVKSLRQSIEIVADQARIAEGDDQRGTPWARCPSAATDTEN
jgi:hypothetical protein